MFGDQRYQHTQIGVRRYRERLEAQKAWPFLTQNDLTKIQTEADLVAMIATRTGDQHLAIAPLVRTWMTGHFRRLGTADPGTDGANDVAPVIPRPDW